MDDLYIRALAWGTFSSEQPLLERPASSTDRLHEQQALQKQGDQSLLDQLLTHLSRTPGQLPAIQAVQVPEFSTLGQWAELFCKAVNQADFLDWADAHSLDFASMQICAGSLSAKTEQSDQPQVFRQADDSGWWKLANPIIYIAQLVDPTDTGIAYIGGRLANAERSLPLEQVLAFHGYPLPSNRLQAQAIIGELQALNGFAGFDDTGQSKSLIHNELKFQYNDLQQLANALDGPLDMYLTHVQLGADSMLARLHAQAQDLMQAIVDDNSLSPLADIPLQHYFDRQHSVLRVFATIHPTDTREVVPAIADKRWERLKQLSAIIGIDIHPGPGLQLARALEAYGIERPASQAQISNLIHQLRERPRPSAPQPLKSARTFAELEAWRQYIGLLNDCHAMRAALQSAVDKGSLDGFDVLVQADPDGLQRILKPAYAELLTLTQDPAFLKIRTQQRIDPASHVLLTESGTLGAYGLDGTWVTLTEAVTDDHQLAVKTRQLALVAKRTGGQLRTNNNVKLVQALRLYRIAVPTTLDEARLTHQRLAVSQPLRAHQKHYWRALQPTQRLQPAGWTLSFLEQQWVRAHTATFMQGVDEPLLEHLCQTLLAGKSVMDVRAEADFLLTRLLAGAKAQQLGVELSESVHWHGRHASETNTLGSRNALVLGALILDLDPDFATHLHKVRHIDWRSPYYWGEPVSLIRHHIECSLAGLGECTAALAAHLLLCAKAPYLLVQGTLDSTPGLASQSWVLFRQYVTYLEAVMPGASQQLSHDEIMLAANLPPLDSWKTFLGTSDATGPVLDWAVASGVLVRQPRADTLAINSAIEALNGQRARLGDALEAFAEPVQTLRQSVLNHSSTGRAVHLSKAITEDYAQIFEHRLGRLQSAYVTSVQYWLSQLTLLEREALEYGDVEFFSLGPPHQVARFGLLIYARFYSDHCFFECFPKHLLIRRRHDLTERALLACSAMAFDWQAYTEGTAPLPLERTPVINEPVIRKFQRFLPAPDSLPAVDENGLRIPRTFDSQRSLAVATLIVEDHLLHDAQAFKERLRAPVASQQALDDNDPWSDYLNGLTP